MNLQLTAIVPNRSRTHAGVTAITILMCITLGGCKKGFPTQPMATRSADGSLEIAGARRRPALHLVVVLPPPCVSPAPFFRAAKPAIGYIVRFSDETDNVDEIVTSLQSKYGIVVKGIFRAGIRGFAADMSPETVAALRCELVVVSVSQDSVLELS